MMKKTIKTVMILMILSLNIFVSKGNIEYAFAQDINVDSLVENKNNQDELKRKISDIEKNLESKSRYADNENQEYEVEVVSISFVDNALKAEESLINEVAYIEKEKLSLEKELEECMIEGIRIEKAIKEDRRKELEENNLSFVPGIWPVPLYSEISSPFGERIHPITGEQSFHKGIDIPAPQNTEIVSSDDGIVIFSGMQNGYGNVVKIKHFDGKNTVYAHNTLNVVQEGDIVRQGQTIAKVGTTGNSTGNHLHFETIVNEENLNPINAVNK